MAHIQEPVGAGDRNLHLAWPHNLDVRIDAIYRVEDELVALRRIGNRLKNDGDDHYWLVDRGIMGAEAVEHADNAHVDEFNLESLWAS